MAAIIKVTSSNGDAWVQSQSKLGDATPPEVVKAQERVSVLSGKIVHHSMLAVLTLQHNIEDDGSHSGIASLVSNCNIGYWHSTDSFGDWRR